MKSWLYAAAASVFLLASADAAVASQSGLQPPGWDANLKLPEAVDTNPDPRILETTIEARPSLVEIQPGKRVEAWTYNGGLPGPLIRLRVGDRLIVHFTNKLPKPTTVHWHGLRVPIQMDGVPGASQPEVQPGGTFTYDFVVPDAGLFWYHPHVMSAAQVGFGLYGPLLVEDPAERVGAADELVLVLSDIGLTEKSGELEAPDAGGSLGMVFGREGNHVLVNGRVLPHLTVRSGVPQRWRIVNAAKSRYFQLYLHGHTFTKIGVDGGLLEYPVKSDTVLLATGERVDVLVTPQGVPKSPLVVAAPLHNRGYGSVEYRDQPDLFTIDFANQPPHAAGPLPNLTRRIEPLPLRGATAVKLDLTIGQLPDRTFEFGINGVPFAKNVNLRAKLGETQVWTITNTTPWSHPFHLHGFFFQVLDEQGTPVRPLAWKDTVNVPFKQTVRVAVRFDDRPGNWMYHCHILDHADGGLMGTVTVGDVPAVPHQHASLP
jgi:FtsP/CotA-like multicopper oxidase with cupredoxin domain